VARASSAGARRALVACEAWRGSALARMRRQAERVETRVSRAQERSRRLRRADGAGSRALGEQELKRNAMEVARRFGSGADRSEGW
jgi:hypothetical protein